MKTSAAPVAERGRSISLPVSAPSSAFLGAAGPIVALAVVIMLGVPPPATAQGTPDTGGWVLVGADGVACDLACSQLELGRDGIASIPPSAIEGPTVELAPFVIETVGDDAVEANLARLEARTREMRFDAIYAARTDERFFNAPAPGTPAETPRIAFVPLATLDGTRRTAARWIAGPQKE